MRNAAYFVLGLVLGGVLALGVAAWGQDFSTADPGNINLDSIGGTSQSGADVIDTTNNAVNVTIVDSDVADTLQTQTTTLSSTSETTIITAGSSGVFRDIVTLIISNEEFADMCYTLRDSTGGSTVAVWCLTGSGEGNYTYTNPAPIPQSTAANNWTIELSQAKDTTVLAVFRERT